MVSGSISPRYSRYFSPFLHSTGSLSVSQEYLALPDGAGGFRRGVSDPALLRIPLNPKTLRIQGFHLLRLTFPGNSSSVLDIISWSYNPAMALTIVVWALPRSLATTYGIIGYFLFLGVLRCFSSPAYHVTALYIQAGIPRHNSRWVSPFGYLRIKSYLADPRSFSQLITSFFGI